MAVIDDPKLKAFVESPISNEFGLSVSEVAEACKGYGRFSAWLNGNVTQITQVLNVVKDQGMSPAYFASYEATEGYNSSWGWLNHTVPQGNAIQDARFVANKVIETSQNTGVNPSWIDYGNPVDFVPQSVKNEGNAHFRSLPTGTIGRSFIPLTAAATWEVYYPEGLLAEYNGVQNYGAPLTRSMELIEQWGGNITGGSDGEEPTPSLPDLSKIGDILNQGKNDLINSLEINFDKAIEYIMKEFEKLFNRQTFNISKDYETNAYFKIFHTYRNLLKINPTPEMIDKMLDIVIEGLKRIEISFDFDSVFDNIGSGIGDLFEDFENDNGDNANGGSDGDSKEPVFPINYNAEGVNFWTPPYANNIARDMDYGSGRGRWHNGYDIGTGGNPNLKAYAMNDGEVIHIGYHTGAGHTIQIQQDDGYYITYLHLQGGSFEVNTGDRVSRGQPVATVGASGGNYAIHLHVEVHRENDLFGNETSLDPKDYLQVTGDNQTNLANPVG